VNNIEGKWDLITSDFIALSRLHCATGRKNLVGATKYWLMAIDLRTYLFQVRCSLPFSFMWCSVLDIKAAASIFQVLPGSPIFRLPVLTRPDVRNWMTTVFPTELAQLQASAGSPVDLMRIQNEAMRQALEENRVQLREVRLELAGFRKSFERRTAVLSPAKAYSHQAYTGSGMFLFISCWLSFSNSNSNTSLSSIPVNQLGPFCNGSFKCHRHCASAY
jgi:hypothetical protein